MVLMGNPRASASWFTVTDCGLFIPSGIGQRSALSNKIVGVERSEWNIGRTGFFEKTPAKTAFLTVQVLRMEVLKKRISTWILQNPQ